MTRIFISLKIPGGSYGECVLEPCLDCQARGAAEAAHDKLWVIYRRALSTGLAWSAARINGEEVLIEGSLPNRVDRLPRDAREIAPEHAAQLWHDDNESHTFGGPNIAKALREVIARSNASSTRA